MPQPPHLGAGNDGRAARPHGVRKGVDLYRTSLSTAAVAHRVGSVTAHLFAVADGVGGRPLGDMASERAVAAILAYVGQVAACFQAFNAVSEHGLLESMQAQVTTKAMIASADGS